MNAPHVSDSFYEDLKGIASELSLEWAPEIERWVVWYTAPNGKKHRIHEVKNPDGTYRHPDNRVLEMLRRCDMSRRVEDPEYILSEQFKRMKRNKEIAKQKQREEIRYRAQQEAPMWAKAADLAATKGIYKDSQLDKRVMVTVPSATKQLINKLGAPNLPGMPKIIT